MKPSSSTRVARAPARALRPTARFAATLGVILGTLATLYPGEARALVQSRNMALLAHLDEYAVPTPGLPFLYSACWSYVHGDGREYAVLGTVTGTAIYNVTVPASAYRVGFVPGPLSTWREMKSYRQWIYVVSEGDGGGRGLQIIRMSDPEHPVLAATRTTDFIRSHTVSVDTTRALLVCNGTSDVSGQPAGMHILSLADPESPVELSRWPAAPGIVPADRYVHDCVLAGDRLYASSIYAGTERLLDTTDPAAPVETASWSYPAAHYTHSAWPDASGRWLYAADEQNGQALRVFDLANPASPLLVNGITSNPQAIIHNPRVKGGELYLANYTEGVRVLDLSDPAHPAEFAWADTYPGVSGGYGGVWEVCPFFPSGTVIASDMQSGLYVYRPQRDYGLLRARVVDALGAPLADLDVALVTQGDSLRTPADGIVQFAPSPGVHTVRARRWGFDDATATRTVSVGSRDTVTLVMQERPSGTFAGTVRDAATQAPLEEAEVRLLDTPLHAHTDGQGGFALAPVPADLYRVEVRCAGHVPWVADLSLDAGASVRDVALAPTRTWDALEGGAGWTAGAPGDDATSGQWTDVSPLGTGPPPPPEGPAAATSTTRPLRPPGPLHEEPASTSWGNAQPYADHTPGAGTQCFVTGQGTDSANPDQADVDYGATTMTSPALDMSGMERPTIGYWRWFYSWFVGTGQPDPGDGLAVLISGDDGATWAPVETLHGWRNRWEEGTIAVADHVTPGPRVRLRFVAFDRGNASLVEAGVDDLTTYDAASATSGVPGAAPRALRFRAPWPNPARGAVTFVLDVPEQGVAGIELLDTAGRLVRTFHPAATGAGALVVHWDGTDERGRAAPAGLYFVRARSGPREASARFAFVR